MDNVWFYIKLGLAHVLNLGAYDHILFLTALVIPFTFKNWKKVLLLATVFTVTHCLSLGLSAYGVLVMDVGLIEFLIPLTILLTAIFNLIYTTSTEEHKTILLHLIATGFFGLIHGFGFSNYFNMLMSGEDKKLGPLLGFATGIEISQLTVVIIVLGFTYIFQSGFGVKKSIIVLFVSVLIILATIPMLINTFPR